MSTTNAANAAAGIKNDTGKTPWQKAPWQVFRMLADTVTWKLPPAWDLVPWDAAAAIAQVLAYGADKYAPRNWEKGLAQSRLFAGVMRHTIDWYLGQDKDKETGFSELAHAGCGIMMMLAQQLRSKTKWDDRLGVDALPADMLRALQSLRDVLPQAAPTVTAVSNVRLGDLQWSGSEVTLHIGDKTVDTITRPAPTLREAVATARADSLNNNARNHWSPALLTLWAVCNPKLVAREVGTNTPHYLVPDDVFMLLPWRGPGPFGSGYRADHPELGLLVYHSHDASSAINEAIADGELVRA